MRVTITDVAKLCDVDISTVSRALRNDPRVRKSTAERVAVMARRLGYEPNLAARMLRSRRSQFIWFLAPDLGNPVDPDLVEQAGLAAAERNFDLAVSLHFGKQEVFDRLLAALGSGLADGAIINRRSIRDTSAVGKLVDRGFPLVVVDVPIDSIDIPTVTTDQAIAATRLSEACIEQGANSGLLISGDRNVVDRRRVGGGMRTFVNRAMPVLTVGLDGTNAGALDLPSPVAIVGTSQSEVLDAVCRHSTELKGKEIIFGCFDSWIGSVKPACAAFVAIQDSKAIAAEAIGKIISLLKGVQDNSLPLETDIPLREIKKIVD